MRHLLKKIKYKFIYALRGLWIAIIEEQSLWIHIFVVLMVIGFGIYFHVSLTDWAILVITFAVVISFEILNTSIESLVDMIAFEYNLKVKKIKDIAAAATLVSALFSVVVGLLIFVPLFIERFS